MTLDVGNEESIDQPSSEQVEHYLRFMPPDAQFVILSAAADSFIQAAPEGEQLRVELWQGKRHRFALLDFEQAVQTFEGFRTGDESMVEVVPWKAITVLSDPYHPARLIVLAVIGLTFIVLSVWSFLQK